MCVCVCVCDFNIKEANACGRTVFVQHATDLGL